MTPTEESFGVYVHVPYCRSICPYCDFNVHIAKNADWQGLAEAYERELEARASAFAVKRVDSIYFGGGTPSLAPPELFARVLKSVRGRWDVASGAEITVEVDPGTLDAAGFVALKDVGATRISLGWQSTNDAFLRVLGRNHDAAAGLRAFGDARAAGFTSISVDLIFAVPGQTLDDLERELDALERLGAEHVSLYALTFHEGTPYARWQKTGRVRAVDEEVELAMMWRIDERLRAAGFEHYEVSNFGKPGFRALHNRIYWSGGQYLGVGPGAHSFLRRDWREGWRWEAVRAPSAYVSLWRDARAMGLPESGDASVNWVESLDARQLLNERLLTGLRQLDGVDVSAWQLGEHAEVFWSAAREAEKLGWLRVEGTRLVPTREGISQADVLAELFF